MSLLLRPTNPISKNSLQSVDTQGLVVLRGVTLLGEKKLKEELLDKNYI